MILQALKQYYDRKADDPASGIAPLGWEWKEIPYLIVLKTNGMLLQIEDTQETVGKKKRAKLFLVPQSVKRTVGVSANLLWDNVEYVTGIVCKGKLERVAEQHQAFLERLKPLATKSEEIVAIQTFLKSSNYREQLEAQPVWQEAVKNCAFISFKMAGAVHPVFMEEGIVSLINSTNNLSGNTTNGSVCLVSGKHDIIANLHPAIKGVRDTNTTGGNIVSFNFPAACSFEKRQGDNAPIGERTAFEYTTAINSLLGKDSRQKMQVGDATTIFWSSQKSTLENDFTDLFSEPEKDNPDRNVDAVERLLTSVETGAFAHETDDTRFYVLGLSPNAARIAVRFWHEGTVAEMERRFADWFENLRIVHGPNDKEHLSLWRLLVSLAPLGKSENIPPNLAGAVMRSILEGTPYPTTMLSSALVRIKAERDVNYPRAKLVKAYLNHNNQRNITVSLNKDNTDVGYRLGRLFAVLERIQQVANPGINATIRDKFYASASATPSAVFGNLMRLKNHHLSKLNAENQVVFFEKLLGEIIYQAADKPGIAAFPTHLSLEEQGQFAIGYYHQKQDFYTKKEDNTAKSSQDTEMF